MKAFKYLALVSISVSLLMVASCKKDDHGNEQELITTVKIELVDQDNPSDIRTFQWKDLDGPGGNNPTMDSINVKTGRTYNGKVFIYNEANGQSEDLTKEVEAEKNVHQFFYLPSSSLQGSITIEVTDKDSNNPPLPVGLTFKITSSGNSSPLNPKFGSLNVILSHYDEVKKSSQRSPESDLDIQFPLALY